MFIAIRFFIFVPLHNLFMNQLEIFRGILLALFAVVCGLHKSSGNNLYVPGCLLLMLPFISFAVFLVHRRYYNRLLVNTEIISDFAFEIKCRVLLELRSKVTNKEELRAMDVEHLRMFKKFESLYKLREITLVWFIHFFANSTISINHVL
jgi:hypothetical protein